jgi:riboflavin biosynthesis pyrimidine reductase
VKIVNDKIDLEQVFEKLASIGVSNLLVEGGGVLASQLIEKKLVDRIIIFTSGLILGASGIPSVSTILNEYNILSEFPKLELSTTTMLDGNIESIWNVQ